MVDMIRKFADDTKLVSTVETESDRENLQAALDNLTTGLHVGNEFNEKNAT
jgi:hypothetical protein